MSDDINHPRAKRNCTIDETNKFKADRTSPQAKVESPHHCTLHHSRRMWRRTSRRHDRHPRSESITSTLTSSNTGAAAAPLPANTSTIILDPSFLIPSSSEPFLIHPTRQEQSQLYEQADAIVKDRDAIMQDRDSHVTPGTRNLRNGHVRWKESWCESGRHRGV